jgi:hypothetical protein
MNFFLKKTTWSNLEFIPLKLCIASAYLLIGSWFPEFFQQYKVVLLVLFVLTVIWSVYKWYHKMHVENPH